LDELQQNLHDVTPKFSLKKIQTETLPKTLVATKISLKRWRTGSFQRFGLLESRKSSA